LLFDESFIPNISSPHRISFFHHTLIGISFPHIAQMSLSLLVIIWLILLKYTHMRRHGTAVYPLSWQQLLKGRKGDMTGSLSPQ